MTLSSCCCCIELRVGCLIIGYLNLFGDIAMILSDIKAMVFAGALASQGEDNEWQTTGTSLLIITAIYMVLFILSFAFAIVLLVGIHQNKRGHVKAFLIYSVICLVLYIIMFVASLAWARVFISISEILTILIIIRTYRVLSFYYFFVIKRYYEKMNTANKPAIYNTA